MFSSSGYFKGVNCPYYASGLCERTYCHFRHVRNETPAQAKRNAVNSSDNVKPRQTLVGVTEPVKRNGLGGQPSLLGMVGSAIKQVQRDIEKDKAVIQHLQPNSKVVAKPGFPNYSPTPIDQSGTKTAAQKKQPTLATYLPPGVPAYKPTPIHLLQRKKQTPAKSVIEYDPLSNSALSERITLADAEQKSAVKREPDCPNFCPGKVIKQERKDLGSEEVEAKFSSEDEDLPNNATDADVNGSEVKEEAVNDSRGVRKQHNDVDGNKEDLVKIKKEKYDSGFECDQKCAEKTDKETEQRKLNKQSAVVGGHEVNENQKENHLDRASKDTQNNCDASQGQTEKTSGHSDVIVERNEEVSKGDCKGLENKDGAEDKDGQSVDEKENGSKNKEKKKESHRSSRHKSSRDSTHRHRHVEDNHRRKDSEKAQDKQRRHESHSSPGRQRHSASSKHGHVDKKSLDHRRSKDRHRIKEQGRRHHHKKSAKMYSRSHRSRKKSKSSHKYRKSDRRHHHNHRKRHSSSKSASSKRKRRHSSATSDSSCSSFSSSSSSSFDSSSDWCNSSSSSQLSQHSKTSSSHKHHNQSELNIQNSSSAPGSHHDEKVSTSSRCPDSQPRNNKFSDIVEKDASGTLGAGSGKTNLFEKFQRTVSCVDLFGEDSSESDSGKQLRTGTAVPSGSGSSKDVILLSDDDDDGCHVMEVSSDVKDEATAKQAGIKRKLVEDENDNKEMKVSKTIGDQTMAEDSSSLVMKRRRLAHVSNPDAMIKRKAPPIAPHRPSPAQIMINRFKELQKQQENQESDPGPAGSNNQLEENDLNGKRRVAHTVQGLKQGHTLMKKRAGTVKKTMSGLLNSAEPQANSTKAGTIAKGASRQAHVPNQKMLKRPIIPVDGGSKVATIIRQRYLNLFVDECLKIYPQPKDAYDRALLEERSVCTRASNKKIYLNLAVNTLKKLRDEVIKSSDSSDQEVKSPTKNPLALSHAAVLGGAKAANTRFTIKRSKGGIKLPAHLSSHQLYILLSKYILTEDQLVENSFPRPVPSEPGHAKLQLPDRVKQMPANSTEKACSRCGKRFFVSVDGVYVTQDNCIYHWGRCWKRRIAGSLENRYTCCQGDTESQGCQLSQFHVHEQNKYKDMTGYVQTQPVSPPPDGDYALYAMDCEMVYTRGGCELARVTVIDTNLQPVYEAIVLPEYEVIDYNTRFSGLTADDMKGVTTKLGDVQAKLLSMFNDKTILMGHSLESDFIALKLLHNTVVDTSVVFPHKLGPPYKRALRTLMAEILQKIIQNDAGGHDSKEDAAACMELMIWKAKDDAKKH